MSSFHRYCSGDANSLSAVLIGGEGDDVLHGGHGGNVLVGGRGEDLLVGERGEDLLIGGFTSFDDNVTSLAAILAEWSSRRKYLARVANLRGDEDSPHFSPNRANGQVFLRTQGPLANIFDDHERDKLTGSASRDWYFAALGGRKQNQDRLTDWLAPELVGLL